MTMRNIEGTMIAINRDAIREEIKGIFAGSQVDLENLAGSNAIELLAVFCTAQISGMILEIEYLRNHSKELIATMKKLRVAHKESLNKVNRVLTGACGKNLFLRGELDVAQEDMLWLQNELEWQKEVTDDTQKNVEKATENLARSDDEIEDLKEVNEKLQKSEQNYEGYGTILAKVLLGILSAQEKLEENSAGRLRPLADNMVVFVREIAKAMEGCPPREGIDEVNAKG